MTGQDKNNQTEEGEEGGRRLRQCRGATPGPGPPGTGGCGLSSETHLLVCMWTNRGSNTQEREYSTVPSSSSLTSSFSLLPSYCVGGRANRKVTVSEWGRGQKLIRNKLINKEKKKQGICFKLLGFSFEFQQDLNVVSQQ